MKLDYASSGAPISRKPVMGNVLAALAVAIAAYVFYATVMLAWEYGWAGGMGGWCGTPQARVSQEFSMLWVPVLLTPTLALGCWYCNAGLVLARTAAVTAILILLIGGAIIFD